MHFDGLIFDLDGTLWDCSLASADAATRAYEHVGVSKRITQEFIASISGKPSSECDAILLADVPLGRQQQFLTSWEAFEIAAIRERAPTALYAGVLEGLKALQLHYKLLVVSNCSKPYLDIFHRYTTIGACILDSECFGRTEKPKCENIQAVVERQKLLSPCYIGDTASDEAAAVRAGVSFIHVSYGFGTVLGTPLAFASFMELARYLVEAAHSRSVT